MTHQAKVFLDLGFDVLIPDQRNSGDNISKYNTFGVLESFDILDCLNYAKSIYDGKILLFLRIGRRCWCANSCIKR